MAARTGVRCLFGSYVKQFYSTSRLSRTFYLFVPKYVSHTIKPMRSHALFSNISCKLKLHNFCYFCTNFYLRRSLQRLGLK
jgi:hypothetical protein